MKGVPTDITDKEFLEFLDLNKINYAKAERLKSKKDSRVLPIFQLEINDSTEAEALLSQNLVCQVTGIVYKVEEFRTTVSVTQVRPLGEKTVGQNKNVWSAVRVIPTKDARIRKLGNLSVPTVRGHMLRRIKGFRNTKSRHLGNMW